MKVKLSILFFLFFTVKFLYSQERIPPPPCYGNQNTGAGGTIGRSYFLNGYSGDVIEFGFGNYLLEELNFNDVFVIYIATDAPGRNILDQTVDDADDPYRIAITNSNTYGFGSTITFPEGFEASYAIAIDTNSGGLYSIPSSGEVGNGGLNYITSVNSTLISSTQTSFSISFTPSDIDIANEEEFYFVGLYVGHNGYTYDEGYGDGILEGTQGADDVTFTSSRTIEMYNNSCPIATLNNYKNSLKIIDAKYVNNKLSINGVNDEVTIRLYDLMGREVLNIRQQVNGNAEIPIELLKNQLQFIVIETSNKKKVLKVIPNTH
jgi:hypothetical protein